MNSRIEKNRHHLATVLAGLLALPLGFLIAQGGEPETWQVLIIATLLLGRTVVIESGICRRMNAREKAFEVAARSFLRERFGIELSDLAAPAHEPTTAKDADR